MQGDNKLDRDAAREFANERRNKGGRLSLLLLAALAELDAAENALVDAVEERDIATARADALEKPWLATDQETIDEISDSENVILMRELIYKLTRERDTARESLLAGVVVEPSENPQ